MSLRIFKYNTDLYSFRDLLRHLFMVAKLSNIHIELPDLMPEGNLDLANESKTDFHRVFYEKLNGSWTEFCGLYERFIGDQVAHLIKGRFVYQSLPSFRIHLPNMQAVHKWHCDSDADHGHPDGEVNVFLPITQAFGTNTLWVETQPGKHDYKPIELKYGEFAMFDGNKCRHGNKVNVTGKTRISFDFRVLSMAHYKPDGKSRSITSLKKFEIGDYYREVER